MAIQRTAPPNLFLQFLVSLSLLTSLVLVGVAPSMMQISGVNSLTSSLGVATSGSIQIDPVKSGGDDSIPLPSISIWARRVLGSIFFLALPFYNRILRIEDELQRDLEITVEVLEKVAILTEKVAANVADASPPGGSIRKTALEAEHIAEIVAKDAEETKVILHKVDEIKKEIEDFVMVEKEDLLDMEEYQAKGKKTNPST